ncbi:hypothetical protein CBR_g32409 [Chara braunii]|uniref:Reverse transcriptase n=1 Tax=Chara braunii TaxID=69332 RepID=A0A388JYF4_CHABU|nr:hypothetical protein CBR_g32409 [Chara braunii]|eukprot:GBG62826.1 hypothetical protein CBR_g32409 [Chara braunii]
MLDDESSLMWHIKPRRNCILLLVVPRQRPVIKIAHQVASEKSVVGDSIMRWHDPQGAQKATDAINSFCSHRFKNVRELTDTVERLLVVPGVRFDQQVLITDYLRCLPAEVRTKLVDEAYVEQHTFATFSKKALDIEAKLGSAHQLAHDYRKRLPQDWKKKGQLMFVDHGGQTTEIDNFPDLGEVTEHDGASETSDGGVVAPMKEKAKGTGKKKVVRSTVPRQQQCHVSSATSATVPRKKCHVSNSATSAVPQCHVSSATVPRQQCPATMTGSTLGMPGQLANESIAEYKQRLQTQLALITAEEQRQVAAEVVHLQAEAAATAEKRRLQAEADADTQARCKEAEDLLQRHEATNIEKLKFWHFEQSEEHDDATPEEQHKEFMAKLVTRLVYTCNHLQSELANLQWAVRNHKAQHEDAARALDSRVQDLEQTAPRPEAAQSGYRVAENSGRKIMNASQQLDTLKTEIRQRQQSSDLDRSTNTAKHYKMPTFRIEKFDDYTHQDPVVWWQGFTIELGIHEVPEHLFIDALFLNAKGGCQIWLSHMATVHGVQVFDLHKVSWEDLTKEWKKRFIVDDAPTLAINRIFTMAQGNTATRDWLTDWQKIVATPDLDLPFLHLRREFYNRSCAALSLALGDREQYNTFAEIINKAREIIKTNRATAHEKSTWQPTYVEKVRTGPRPQHVAAVQTDNIVEDPTTTQASREGDQVVAVQPRSNNKSRGNVKAKTASPAGNGQPTPWVKFHLTEAEYKWCDRHGCCYWCNDTNHKTSQCPDQGKEDVRPLPTPLMDAGVEVVDLHNYIAKIDHEFRTQRCHVVSAASMRASIIRDDIEEMGVCFLHMTLHRRTHLRTHASSNFSTPTATCSPHGVIPDRPIRHEIILKDGAVPLRGCIYRMSEEELSVLRAQLDDLLENGWIRRNSSPYGAPVLFVRKKNKDLWLCIDYRKLNAQTIRNADPLPRIDDLLERLDGAKFFSKLDLKSGYHQLEIRQEDCYKTAFKTRYGHFEWLVMPFGLTNAPTTSQAAMTTEFRHMLDRFVLIYLDDILVYNRSLDEHVEHLRTVLERLRQAKYKANRDKCEFAQQEPEYLGYYVTPQGIRPGKACGYPSTFEVPASSTVESTHTSHADADAEELTRFTADLEPAVRDLIREYCDIFPPYFSYNGIPPMRGVEHSIQLVPYYRVHHQAPYRLSIPEATELKRQLEELLRLGFIKPSNSPWGAPVLFARKADRTLRLCIDYRGFNRYTVKNNYPMPRADELFDRLAGNRFFTKIDLRSGFHQIRVAAEDQLKTAFRSRFDHYEFTVMPFSLTNAPATFQTAMNDIFRDILEEYVLVYLDDILVYSRTLEDHIRHLRDVLQRLRKHDFYAKLSKCRFAQRKVDFLGHHVSDQGLHMDDAKITAIADFTTQPIKGETNCVADALSCRPDHNQEPIHLAAISVTTVDQSVNNAYCTQYRHCLDYRIIHATLQSGKTVPSYSLGENGLVYWHGRSGQLEPRICVPFTGQLRVQAVAEFHDQAIAGHMGFHKTLARVCRLYIWPKSKDFVKTYIQECPTCQEVTSANHLPYGLLQPLPIPEGRWQSILMDFIGPLHPPTERGHDAILVVIDRFTKRARFVPCSYRISALEVADIVFDRVVRDHGLPQSIISDHVPHFTSTFWRRLHEVYGS